MSKKVVKYDAPKRPRSAYLIFAAEMRETTPRDPNLSLTDIAKALGERWKGMTAQERQPFETGARVEKEAYETALAEYNRRSPTQAVAVDPGDEDDDAEEEPEVFKPTPILKNKERRFKKDPNAPKRPRTAFFIFAQECRESTPRGPDVPLTTFMMEIANRWKAFTMAERAPYDQRALVEKKAYEAAVAAYNSKPRRLETESDDEDDVIEDKDDQPQSDSEHDDSEHDDDDDDDEKAPARQTKVGKKMKQSEGPRRPLTSYMFYCQTQTRRPDEQTTQFMLRCGEQWKSLPDHERAPFEQQRAADMARYQREKAEFESKPQSLETLQFLSHDGNPSMAKTAKKRAVESDEEGSDSSASDEGDDDDDDEDDEEEDEDSGNIVQVKPVHVFAKRDPNAPKHAMSAFMMFSNATRSQIPRDANASFSEVGKRLAMRWKEMAPEEKSTWEAQARADRARYEEELTKYRQSTQPNTQPAAQVKRKRSAFMFYMDAERGSIGPDISMGERGKILGSRWLAMTPEQKQPWIEMQEEDRRRYEREVAAQRSASQPHANARPKPDPSSDDEEEDEDEEDEGEYEKPTKSPKKSPMKSKKAPPKATSQKKVAIKKAKPLTKVKMGKTVTKKAIAQTSDAEDDEEDDEDDDEDEEETPSPKKTPLIKEGKKRSRKEEDGNDDEKPVTSPAVKLDMSLDDIMKSSKKSSPKKSAPQSVVVREKTLKAPPKKYKRDGDKEDEDEEDKPKAPPKAALMKSPKKEAPAKKPMLKKDEDDNSASDGSPIRAKAPSQRADTEEEDEEEEEAKPKAPRKSTFMKSPKKSSPAKKKSKRKSDVRKDDSDDDDGAAEEPVRTVPKAKKGEDDATPKASPGGMAAYREFSAQIREQVKAENPDATGAEINKIIGARWAEHKRGL